MESLFNHSFLSSPLGWLQVVERDNSLVNLSFVSQPESVSARGVVAQELARLLTNYFVGKSTDFATITMSLTAGTVFQRRIWQELRTIPYGQLVSYRQIAVAIGKPTAYRAVAKAIAANPLVIVIPCHRVVRSDGKLGGYAAGIERKQQLLQLEMSVNRRQLELTQ